ncbi:MAG: hypothetical protein KJT03_22490, partial [Verrucomicrobiae bacterium]|nr:hypothetical protein [Verrucomicrobiae bacterium]
DEPGIITFTGSGNLKTTDWSITVYSQSKPHVPGLETREWYKGAQKVEGDGALTVEWEAFPITVGDSGVGTLKDVNIQRTPFLYGPIISGSTTNTYETRMEVHLASIGETRVQLLREDEIVVEETSENNLSALLRWWPASTDETGLYTVKAENEYGSIESDPFEIFVGEHPLEGLDNEEVYYSPTNPGPHILPSIWHTQDEETFDGVDAVGWKKGQDETTKNFLWVGIREPVLLTFWYKSPGLRVTTEYQNLNLDATEWTQCKILVTEAPLENSLGEKTRPNILEFLTESEGTYLDQLKIDRLGEDPFKAWIYPRLVHATQAFEAEAFAGEDYDGDHKSNLLEWMLNTDPLSSDGIPEPQVEQIGEDFFASFSFESPADLGTYTLLLEACPDLENWKPVDVEITDTPIEGTDRVLRKMQDLAPLGSGQRRFYRISVGQ